METEIYETSDTLSHVQMINFSDWLAKNIGTDVEVNEAERGCFYLMVYDLNFKEVEAIRKYENDRGFNNAE